MSANLRTCWLNCFAPNDKSFLNDREILEIDTMEDSLVTLDDKTAAVRQIIT